MSQEEYRTHLKKKDTEQKEKDWNLKMEITKKKLAVIQQSHAFESRN